MNFRFVFLVVFIFFCVLGVVYGGNNTTLNHSLELNEGYDKYDFDEVYALEDGHFNTSFSGGFNGYCLEYGEEEAVKGDVFLKGDLSFARDSVTGDCIGDYLKVYFIDFYKDAMRDKIVTQHTIWHFSDNFNGWRLNYTMIDLINDKVNDGVVYDDCGYKLLDNGSVMFFEFYTFLSEFVGHQDYFGYKVWFGGVDDIPVVNGSANGTDNITDNITGNGTEVIIENGTVVGNTIVNESNNTIINNYNRSDNYNQEINKQDNPIQLYSTGWNLWLLFCVIVMVLVILILDRRE